MVLKILLCCCFYNSGSINISIHWTAVLWVPTLSTQACIHESYLSIQKWNNHLMLKKRIIPSYMGVVKIWNRVGTWWIVVIINVTITKMTGGYAKLRTKWPLIGVPGWWLSWWSVPLLIFGWYVQPQVGCRDCLKIKSLKLINF